MKTHKSKENAFPLIARGDISAMHVDVIVCGVGCFMQSGFLGASLRKLYGAHLYTYLKDKFNVSKRPAHLPNKKVAKPEDFDDMKKLGGLPQGFSAYVSSDELVKKLKDASKDAPSLVLGVIGGEYVSHINPDAISLLVKSAFATLAEQYTDREKKIIIAFPAFGTGRGHVERIKAIRAELYAMLEGNTRYPHLVPVFVCYSDTIHQVCLNVRKQITSNNFTPFVAKYKMENSVALLKNELESERLVIFAGAGISQSSGLPNWQNLIVNLAQKASTTIPENVSTSDEFLRIAEECRNKLGNNFAQALREILKTEKGGDGLPSLTHYLLATLPVNTIVTTNFDNLLEQAMLRIKKAAFAITNAFDVARAPIKDQVSILKIHGDSEHLDEVTFSKDDYDNYFQKRPAISTLLKGLLLNRTFLFIGYSLRDPNLHIILDEVSSVLKDAQRPIYAIVFSATEEEIKICEERGIEIILLYGENASEKKLALWQLLDSLQSHYYSKNYMWFAEEASELFALTNPKWQKSVSLLQESLEKIAAEIVEEKEISPEIIDFIFPWFSLAMGSGMTMPAELWEKMARYYRDQKSPSEATKLKALASEIAAFRSSDGHKQMKHEMRIWQMRNDWHNY